VSLLIDQIKQHHTTVFRRAYIKRRLATTGQFEDDWVEVTDDVKKWGTYKLQIDAQKPNKFSFANATIAFANDEGKYNPEDDETSIWYTYLSQQRTLFKIEAGFLYQTQSSSGLWTSGELPAESAWDTSLWDEPTEWDVSTSPQIFTGMISGDINLSNKNEVSFTVRPLAQVFIDYPARNLTGWTSTGLTASQFITMLRDQTDGSSNYVFRPFFGNTTSNWDISTTSVVYGQLNTSTAVDVIDSNVWSIVEKLAEAESFVPYVTGDGMFKFVSRSANTSTAAFEFYGSGSHSSVYGNTIKSISRFGKRISKYYSRVQVKWRDADTSTSYEVQQSSLVVSGSNNPWNLGARSLEVENLFIPTSTVAASVALALFNEHSSLKNEIEFNTSFVPHLDILDRIKIYYDSPPSSVRTLWDQNDWADDAVSTDSDLTWEKSTGDAIRLAGEEYKFLSIAMNLDRFECTFEAREI
jgi:hypothetical protein